MFLTTFSRSVESLLLKAHHRHQPHILGTFHPMHQPCTNLGMHVSYGERRVPNRVLRRLRRRGEGEHHRDGATGGLYVYGEGKWGFSDLPCCFVTALSHSRHCYQLGTYSSISITCQLLSPIPFQRPFPFTPFSHMHTCARTPAGYGTIYPPPTTHQYQSKE